MLAWLCQFPPAERTAFLHELLDPSYRVHVPVAMGGGDGWWFQITRRLLWVTPAADEQRLVEPLFPDAEEELRTLAAVEPLLIAGRVTSHPADWAMAVRIWPSAGRPAGRPWWHLASAIHEHGIPILCLDLESTVEEIQCQLLMLAHWHKYVGAREPEIADAIAVAYPQAVARIVSATRAPDTRAAAAMLFEGLLRPGFDPARGAAAARRYVNNKATIAILNHRKTSDGGIRPWEALGVSERRYYKLLNRFAPKTGRRYEVDADVLDRIRAHLIGRDKKTETHAAAMELLQERGFTYSAARSSRDHTTASGLRLMLITATRKSCKAYPRLQHLKAAGGHGSRRWGTAAPARRCRHRRTNGAMADRTLLAGWYGGWFEHRRSGTGSAEYPAFLARMKPRAGSASRALPSRA